MISIPEPGKDHLFPSNHRPISLISCLGKIADAIILSRLKEELFVNNLIQDEEFGFREGLFNKFQVFRLHEAIKNALGKRETVGTVVLVIEKALDTVWDEALIYEMFLGGINPNLIRVVNSYLDHPTFSARQGNFLSTKTRGLILPSYQFRYFLYSFGHSSLFRAYPIFLLIPSAATIKRQFALTYHI